MQLFKSKRSKAAVAALAMLSVLGAACGDDSNDDTAAPKSEQNQPVSTAQSGQEASAQGIDTGAATLRAGLTDLLSEHVYLAALATGSARGATRPASSSSPTPSTARPTATRPTWSPPSARPTVPTCRRPSTACGAAKSTSPSSWPTRRRRPRAT